MPLAMKKLLLSLSVALSLVYGCKPDDPIVTPNPPPVSESDEYFNCYIDGKYWTYKQGSGSFSGDALKAERIIMQGPNFRIQAANHVDNDDNTVIVLWMVADTFPSKDTIPLTLDADSAYAAIVGPNLDFMNISFKTNHVASGELIFTKRTSERLEGTFYFDAQRPDTSVVIHVTNGRFSIIPD